VCPTVCGKYSEEPAPRVSMIYHTDSQNVLPVVVVVEVLLLLLPVWGVGCACNSSDSALAVPSLSVAPLRCSCDAMIAGAVHALFAVACRSRPSARQTFEDCPLIEIVHFPGKPSSDG